MGKRLIRIFQKEIPSQVNALLNLELHLVLKNNTTIHGLLKKIENNILTVEGGLHEKHAVKLDEILEIVYDKEAAF